jgi:hypothetical protein
MNADIGESSTLWMGAACRCSAEDISRSFARRVDVRARSLRSADSAERDVAGDLVSGRCDDVLSFDAIRCR